VEVVWVTSLSDSKKTREQRVFVWEPSVSDKSFSAQYSSGNFLQMSEIAIKLNISGKLYLRMRLKYRAFSNLNLGVREPVEAHPTVSV
jgi:hypothetical protein